MPTDEILVEGDMSDKPKILCHKAFHNGADYRYSKDVN